MTRRLKVLACAYACDPARGSEHGVGWQWAREIARAHDVWLLTDVAHRRSLEEAISREPGLAGRLRVVTVPPKRWHYSDASRLWKWIEGSPAKPIMHLAYAAWQRDACRTARELLRSQSFDLVHQLTFVGFRFPGHLWTLGLPFVWGPIGGMENVPWRLLPALGARGAVEFAGRNLVNSAQKRWLHSARRAARVAGPGLIAATSGIAREIERCWGMDATVMCEATPPGQPVAHAPRRDPHEPLRIVWAGRHLPRKALPLLLAGLARLPQAVDWRLQIYGDGPMRSAWQRKARELGVAERCAWPGAVARADMLSALGRAHVFAISSLQDLTSTVLLEALSRGLPVLCPDHCGFSDVVTDACGIRIPARNIETLVAGFTAAIGQLAEDEQRRHRMGRAALMRARAFMWEHKRAELDRIYARVLAAAAERPDRAQARDHPRP